MRPAVRTNHNVRRGRFDPTPLQWTLLAGCSAWLVVLVAVEAFKWAALAAAGLI